MAFDRTKLIHISGSVGFQNNYEYYSNDNITTTNYFKDADFKAGDKVVKVVIAKSGELVTNRTETAHYIKNEANGEIKAVAM